MITFDYKRVAYDLSLETEFSRQDLEKIQLGVFDMVKQTLLNADVDQLRANNIRIKGFGIFTASEKAIKYYNKKNKEAK